jgi:hypothetical protein
LYCIVFNGNELAGIPLETPTPVGDKALDGYTGMPVLGIL